MILIGGMLVVLLFMGASPLPGTNLAFIIALASPGGPMNMDAPHEESTLCIAGQGCAQKLCLSKDEYESTMSTCEWSDSYACYPQVGKCEIQADGKCGWTDTPELAACLKDPPKSSPVQ